jgi:hypothetical protein
MAPSVREYLTHTLQHAMDNKQVNLMLFTNYKDKMQRFYLMYKNAAFEEHAEELLLDLGLLSQPEAVE